MLFGMNTLATAGGAILGAHPLLMLCCGATTQTEGRLDLGHLAYTCCQEHRQGMGDSVFVLRPESSLKRELLASIAPWADSS